MSELNAARPFEILHGEKLSAVTFVLDYWQLQFDGPAINVLSRIELRGAGATVSDGDFGFRDRLCGQIGKEVSGTELSGTALTIRFSDRSSISISLRDEDYHGPEAILLMDHDRRVVVAI